MISGLVLNHLNGLGLVMTERYSAPRPASSWVCMTEPTQVLEPQDNGSLIVRFTAAGWLKMAWDLHQLGDRVEAIAPDGLRALAERYRGPDLAALP
jgi:hypothetical protein